MLNSVGRVFVHLMGHLRACFAPRSHKCLLSEWPSAEHPLPLARAAPSPSEFYLVQWTLLAPVASRLPWPVPAASSLAGVVVVIK